MTRLPLSLDVSGFLLCVLAVLVGACAWRSTGRVAASGKNANAGILAGIGLLLLAFGGRLAVADGRISWAPYLDQWHAELGGVLVPWVHGSLSLRDFAAGNNEHRVILTRVLALALTWINGTWDNRALVVVNYLLEAVTAAWVSALSWKFLGWARGSAVAVVAILPLFLLGGWEVLVSSNQSQFVFMAAGSVFALSLFQDYSLGSAGSWGALALSILMLGSMASGFLTAVSLLASGVFLGVARRRIRVPLFGFASACAAIGALGWMTKVPNPALQPIYAHSFGVWLNAFVAYASWPLPSSVAGAAALWAPWIALAVWALKKRAPHPLVPFAFGLGLWVLLQCAALGWTRAGLSGLVSSRYTEFVGWGVVANAVSLGILTAAVHSGHIRRFSAALVLTAWVAAVCGSEIRLSHTVYRPYLESFQQESREHEQRLGDYLRTGNPAAIRGVPFPHIPYYEPELILKTLGDTEVRTLLPPPLQREGAASQDPATAVSVPDGALTRAALRAMRWGRWIAAVGIGILAWAVLLLAARPGSASPGDRSRTA